MLPFWLPRLRRKQRNRKTKNPTTIANATTEPMAMPAIAPPDNLFEFLAIADAEADDDDVDDAVGAFVENVMKAVIVGSTTPAHLLSAPEL